MGEVLENGVYLPDEGERNAYNGLKGNWNTVDTVVAQVQALSSTGLIRKAVDELPTEDIETNVIYMLKAVKPNGDVYRIEYMYIDGHWDALGTSETTLDDYYTKAETDDLPAVKSGINATKVSNYDTHLANNDIHVTLANKQSWNGKQNALDTAQTAAVNSGVNATKVTGYDTHVSDTDIHVTTSDKAAWNAKQDGLSQTQLAAVNSGVTEAKITGYDSHVADTNVHVTTADKAGWNGKQNALTQTQLDNIAAVPDKADSADLATVATTGDYGDLLNAPTIPTVNNASLTIQKNGTDVATFTANASSNVTANLAIPVNTSDLNNDAGFLTQHNPIDTELSATSENALQNKVVKSELDGKAPLVHTHSASDVTSGTFNIARIPNLDASKITSGTIDIARLPKGSLERLIKVADQTARYALTTDDVQLGDTVQQLDTGVMYVVTDETKLDSADGYTEFTAGAASSVPWTGVTGKPNDYPPSSHTHTKSQITDFPALATVATSGSYNDLSNIPASFTPSSHTHGNITNDGKVGTTANKPLITGGGGRVMTGAFGNAANTFCEGNDSRLSDARTPVAHTHGKADITDLFNSANTWTEGQTIYSYANIQSQVLERAVTPANTAHVSLNLRDKNNHDLGIFRSLTYSSSGNSIITVFGVTQIKDGQVDPTGTVDSYGFTETCKSDGTKYFTFDGYMGSNLVPLSVNQSIGSSSYQWNNLYAKNYYYNGTAWGLDKANHWTDNNTFDTTIRVKSLTQEIGVTPSASRFTYCDFRDKNEISIGQVITAQFVNGYDTISLNIYNKYTNGVKDPNGTSVNSKFEVGLTPEGNPYLNTNGKWLCDLTPIGANRNLGTSTNKWATLNGINPGALSLPNLTMKTYDPNNGWYDLDTTDWDLTGSPTDISSDVLKDGYLYICLACDSTGYVIICEGVFSYPNCFYSASGLPSSGYARALLPVRRGTDVRIYLKGTSVYGARLFPALGNV